MSIHRQLHRTANRDRVRAVAEACSAQLVETAKQRPPINYPWSTAPTDSHGLTKEMRGYLERIGTS